MIFEIREKIVILTSEKWVDKSDIAKRIGNAYGDKNGLVIHFDSLRRKYKKKLGSDFTEDKLSAHILEYVARAFSASLLTGSYLVLDTDVDDIPGFETLLKTVERVQMLIDEMKDEYDEVKVKNHGPVRILHLSIPGTEAEKEAYFRDCRAEIRDEIYPNMGEDAEILADLLLREKKARLEKVALEYAGLRFKKYYTFSPILELSEATIDDKENLDFMVNL